MTEFLNNFQWRKELFVLSESKTELGVYVEKYFNALFASKNYCQFLDDFKTFEAWNVCDSQSVIESLCKIFCELSVTEATVEIDDVPKHCNFLLEKNERSFTGLLTKAVISYNMNDFVNCRDILLEGKFCNLHVLVDAGRICTVKYFLLQPLT